MDNQSDHDLLIALNTKMEMMLVGQQQFINQWITLVQRVTAIEIAQGRQSSEIENLESEIADLRRRTTVADSINAAVAALAGAIGYFFSPK
jgi:hypothetical protein